MGGLPCDLRVKLPREQLRKSPSVLGAEKKLGNTARRTKQLLESLAPNNDSPLNPGIPTPPY